MWHSTSSVIAVCELSVWETIYDVDVTTAIRPLSGDETQHLYSQDMRTILTEQRPPFS